MQLQIRKLFLIITAILLACLPTFIDGKSPNVDQDCATGLGPAHKIWRSNQTHELHLDIAEKISGCFSADQENCPPEGVVLESTIDIQCGDVLLVYMNESIKKLNPTTTGQPHSIPTASASSTTPNSETSLPQESLTPTSASTTPAALQQLSSTSLPKQKPLVQLAVYSVTRPGPTSCDVSDGVQLDMTPVMFDGNILLTFYDKDLTEGVNMLLVVSGSWAGHCIKLKVTVKSENCGENEDCSGKGVCYTNTSLEDYQCECCPGYIGPHCEEKDACFHSPCQNNGICVDISQGQEGSTFQCLCPYGFTGKVCEDTSDPCESSPCHHGGKCKPSNETAQQYKCICPPGFTGPQCQNSIDACASSPCRHGICVDQRDGYKCFCQPGFTGSQCQDEFNECDSNPCLNGGTCTDHIDSYSCNCDRGYTGKRCQIKKDLCIPNPCSHHHYCQDKGNTYTCECPKGFTGTNCIIPTRAACSANPCRNGGTCWSSVDSFYCACRPGFTGKICNEEVIIEVIPSVPDTIEVDGNDQPMDLQMPMDMARAPVSIHLDHLHNVYVAAGTLACAILIVIVTVIICHCRMHETYKHCCFKSSPLLPYNISRFDAVLKKNGLEKDKEPLAQSRPFPALDSSDMYYALDFSDSQSSPLIQ